jgi:hypothetical protein
MKGDIFGAKKKYFGLILKLSVVVVVVKNRQWT